jgi:2-aminoadipate transaminase
MTVREAVRGHETRRSALQDMLALTERPGIISFALGLPATELLPADCIAEAATKVLRDEPYALQYRPPTRDLKECVVNLMAQRGVACGVEQICITSGAQQGLSLLSHLLLRVGRRVLVEDLTYTGLLQAIDPFCPAIRTVPAAYAEGIDVEAVERELGSGSLPAFMYVMTDGHNPLGSCLSATTRASLAELARQYRVPIVEDDAYGFLRYDSQGLPPIRALEQDWVFYVGSFSKILAPSLRVGWLVVPEELTSRLSAIKEALDINTMTFAQRVVTVYLRSGRLVPHLATLREEYRKRRDTMLCSLRQHFPPEACWATPGAGVFVWVELPEGYDASKLLKEALATAQVAFLPAEAFAASTRLARRNGMRLNFSGCTLDQIEEGVARLGHVLRSHVETLAAD